MGYKGLTINHGIRVKRNFSPAPDFEQRKIRPRNLGNYSP
jgi:hypothetical protein